MIDEPGSLLPNPGPIGFGPSAHSFNGLNRRHNIANTQQYIKSLLTENHIPHEEEILTNAQRYNEFVMTRLRTIWGINENDLVEKFGNDLHQHFLKEVHPMLLQGLVKSDAGIFTLTENGLYFADRVASQLFYTD